MQEGRIKALVELLQLLVFELLTACCLIQILVGSVLDHLVDALAEIVHFIDV
jgi:hypothetical protein